MRERPHPGRVQLGHAAHDLVGHLGLADDDSTNSLTACVLLLLESQPILGEATHWVISAAPLRAAPAHLARVAVVSWLEQLHGTRKNLRLAATRETKRASLDPGPHADSGDLLQEIRGEVAHAQQVLAKLPE